MYSEFNANPIHKRVGDCTVRAISKALDQPWEDTYLGMAVEGFMLFDMPSANSVWGAYLHSKGFKRKLIPDNEDYDYTVRDFCKDFPKGTYILALPSHVIAVIDGVYYDTWDSGNEVPVYYWYKDEEKNK